MSLGLLQKKMNYNKQTEIDSLRTEVAELRDLLEKHQHLGTDNSSELDDADILAKQIAVSSSGDEESGEEELEPDVVRIPLKILDGRKGDKRGSGLGISTRGKKGQLNEQISSLLTVGKELGEIEIVQSNRQDFDKFNFATLQLASNPQFPALPINYAGPSSFPPQSFLYAYRTPIINGTGSISGNTLYDAKADFKNDLTGSFLFLHNGECQRITSSSAKTMTVEEDWESGEGNYSYNVITGTFLGGATTPFTRVYIADDIRFGLGSSNGNGVQYIKPGKGSPEGEVIANPGSLYMRKDGSSGSTLYVKESGFRSSTGWSAVGTISGFTGSFTDGSGNTVSVSNGLITSVS